MKSRVLCLRANWLPVSERFIYDELCCLENYEPVILCLKHDYAFAQKFDVLFDLRFMALRDKAFPLVGNEYAGLHEEMILWAIAGIKEKQIDLLHAPFLSDAAFFLELKHRSRLPLIVSVRGYDLYAMNNDVLGRVFAAADMFLARSATMKRDLIAKGCPPEKVTVQHSGILPQALPARKKAVTGEVRILMAGRLVPKKGVLAGINIFNTLCKAHRHLKLFIVGDGPLRPAVLAAIKRSGFSDKIIFCGEISNEKVLILMKQCDMLLHPSVTAPDGDREGIPGVIMEAMALGMSVVASDNGSTSEIVIDGKTGFLFPEGNIPAALAQMRAVIKARGSLSGIRKAAAEKVREDFNVITETRKLEAIYDSLLRQQRHASYDRYYRNYQHLLAHGRPASFRVDIHPVSGCNSFCLMCDNWKNRKAEILSKKQILAAIRGFKEIGAREIRFHGQEPTLRRDLPALITYAKALGLRVGLKTNCVGLTAASCRRLVGIDTLYVSLDSPDEALHNKLRGNATSFRDNIRVMGIMKALKPGLVTEANAVVTRLNYQSLVDMPRLAAEHGISRVSFVLPNSKNKKTIQPLLMKRAAMEEFFFKIVPRIINDCQERNIAYDFSPFFADLVLEHSSKVVAALTQHPEKFREEIDNYLKMDYGRTFHERYGCHGPIDHASVNYDGSVFPCCVVERAPAFAVGNIAKDAVESFWISEKYAQVRQQTIRTKGACCGSSAVCASNFNSRKALAGRIQADERVGEVLARDYQQKMAALFMMDRAVIDGAVNVRLRAILVEALAACSFYKDRITAGKDGTLTTHGFLTKKNVRDHIHQGLISRKYQGHPRLVSDRTSGSMDETVPFAYLRGFERYVRMIFPFLINTDWQWGGRYAVLTTLHCSREKCTSDDLPDYVDRVKIPTSDDIFRDTRTLQRAGDLLAENQAAVVHADPVYLAAVARYLTAHKKKLSFKGISSTYELLTHQLRRYLEKTFRCRVFDNYGCSETGPIAFACEKGNKHIFENAVLVEIVDKGRYRDPEVGEIVVTTLENPAMPLIRYRTGDLGKELNVPCGCGRKTRMIEVYGRAQNCLLLGDVLYTERDIAGVLDIPGILLYQVSVHGKILDVRVLPAGQVRAAPRQKLTADIRRRLAQITEYPVTVTFTDHLMPEKSGKFRMTFPQGTGRRAV